MISYPTRRRKSALKIHILNRSSHKYLELKYNEGYGYKLIGRVLNLSYSRTIRLFNYLNIKTRKGQNVLEEFRVIIKDLMANCLVEKLS